MLLLVFELWGEGSRRMNLRVKGGGVAGACVVGARFGEDVVKNGFKGVEVVAAVTAEGSCTLVGKLSSG